jgi:DNA-binding NtrC family response regulator
VPGDARRLSIGAWGTGGRFAAKGLTVHADAGDAPGARQSRCVGTHLAPPGGVTKRPRILVVDGDREASASLCAALAGRGFDPGEASSIEEAALAALTFAPDAIVAAVEAPGDGALLVRTLCHQGSDAGVVAIARGETLDAVVAAMRAGAESFLVAPVDPAQAALVLEKVLEKRRLRREGAALREQVRRRHAVVSADPAMQIVDEVVRRAAPTKATVFVQGESGTGRELVAQALHEASPRRDGPFVRVRCSAVSEALLESELFGHELAFHDAAQLHPGRIELAHGGTLFVDEVADLSRPVQVRLLRVLQHGEVERAGGREVLRVDVRVVAASTRDLAEEVRAGRFRDDLYYRLNVVSVTLPPLRARKGDLPTLVHHFLGRSAVARTKGITSVSPGALSALFAHEWPGNTRELEAVVDEAVARCDGPEIGDEHLSPALRGARPNGRGASGLIPGATLFEIERDAILRTLDGVGGSTVRAAEVLGVSVRKIQYRLKDYRSALGAIRRVA